jgi:hypothetical protein
MLGDQPVDLVLSDMAPNKSGVDAVDQPRMMHLAELAMDFADNHLKTGGAFLIKLFQGVGFDDYVRECAAVTTRSRSASRKRRASAPRGVCLGSGKTRPHEVSSHVRIRPHATPALRGTPEPMRMNDLTKNLLLWVVVAVVLMVVFQSFSPKPRGRARRARPIRSSWTGGQRQRAEGRLRRRHARRHQPATYTTRGGQSSTITAPFDVT